mmetsp:Transcript_23580/g.49372  ORF Transcript_23580/g.49372 Transcript_23580/m.49372 type:complete len:280 (+) Transcript_23580:321-1160(+)
MCRGNLRRRRVVRFGFWLLTRRRAASNHRPIISQAPQSPPPSRCLPLQLQLPLLRHDVNHHHHHHSHFRPQQQQHLPLPRRRRRTRSPRRIRRLLRLHLQILQNPKPQTRQTRRRRRPPPQLPRRRGHDSLAPPGRPRHRRDRHGRRGRGGGEERGGGGREEGMSRRHCEEVAGVGIGGRERRGRGGEAEGGLRGGGGGFRGYEDGGLRGVFAGDGEESALEDVGDEGVDQFEERLEVDESAAGAGARRGGGQVLQGHFEVRVQRGVGGRGSPGQDQLG